MNIFALDIRFLKAQCVFGVDTVTEYFGKLFIVLSFIIGLFGFAKFSRTVWPATASSILYMDQRKTINTFGTVYQGTKNTFLDDVDLL